MDNDNHTDLQSNLHRSVIEQVSSLSVRSHQNSQNHEKNLGKMFIIEIGGYVANARFMTHPEKFMKCEKVIAEPPD